MRCQQRKWTSPLRPAPGFIPREHYARSTGWDKPCDWDDGLPHERPLDQGLPGGCRRLAPPRDDADWAPQRCLGVCGRHRPHHADEIKKYKTPELPPVVRD